MQRRDSGRQRASHDQPGDDLRTFHAAEFRVFGKRDLSEALRIIDQEVEELRVPFRVIETASFAVDLMGNASGGDDGNVDILGITLDGTAQCFSRL